MRLSCLTMGFLALSLAPSVAFAQTNGAADAAASGEAAASPAATSAAPSGGAEGAAPAATPEAAAPEAAAPAEPQAVPTAAPAEPASEAQSEPAPIVYAKAPAKKADPADLPPPDEVDPWKVPWTHHVSHIYLNAFAGLLFTPDATYDLFADTDASFAFGARVGVPLFAMGHTGVSLTADWLATGQDGYARSVNTQLGQHRFGLGVELKHLFTPTVGAYARLSAGAAYLNSRLGNENDIEALYADSWEFQGAGVLGGSVMLIGNRDGRKRSARLYLTAEFGYTFVAETSLSYLPGEFGPPRAEPFVVDGLYLGGPLATLGLAIGF